MSHLTLTLLQETFTVHRLPVDAVIPAKALDCPFVAITRTRDELSLVLPKTIEIDSQLSESGWACFKVEGPLDFGLVGILASIAQTLAEAQIPIFAISTFETDYILVKKEQVEAAGAALSSGGYQVKEEQQ